MSTTSNVIVPSEVTQGPRTQARPKLGAGVLLGLLGVVGFSLSLPATRLAVADLDPWLVAFGRAAVAAVGAAMVLIVGRAPLPSRAQMRSLLIVALGVVVGFPLFSSLALHERTAAHGAVIIAVLPIATALWALSRAGERPTRAFWIASVVGMLAVLAFAATAGAGGLGLADGFLLLAVALGGLGYAEGGTLARDLGGARTICWALIVALPLTLPITIGVAAWTGLHASPSAWLGFAYVALISMFVAFFAWYAGLARGGVARIGQVQLAQPVLTLLWAALFLGEVVTGPTILAALAVLACAVATQRAR